MTSAEAAEGARLRPLAASVWWVAGALTALLVALAPQYGWHRDELYFLEAGRHLAWGYIDQPPFAPLVARIADEVAPGNLAVLRLLPALSSAATVILGAALVREMGGGRRAQVVGAGVVAASGFVLGVGHLLSTATFDLTAWMALLLIFTRLERTADPRLWIAFGAVAGVALWNKHLVAMLAVALVAALVVERRWDLLTPRWLLGGGVLALLIASPNLAWQATNGWPQLDMAQALAERLAAENRATLVPLQLLFLGPFLLPLLWWGGRALLRDDALRPFRPLLWAWPSTLVIVFATGGRPYYVFPLTLVVALCGVVVRVESERRAQLLPLLVVANAAFSIPLGLPVLPISAAGLPSSVNDALAETIGWPELADQVAGVVDDLPARERVGVVLVTASYGEAGALDRFGPARGLPPVYSAHNSYADFRRPTDATATVVAVRYSMTTLERHFDHCAVEATVDNAHGIENEVRGSPIIVCRGLRGDWPEVWDQLRHLD